MQSKMAATAAAAAEDDYPCVRLLRHRRLLAYLHNHGFQAAFHSVIQELGQREHTAVFSAAHLRKLVAGGRWGEALRYVVPDCLSLPMGLEGRTLLTFLLALATLGNVAATGSRDPAAAVGRNVFLRFCHRSARLSSIVDTMVDSPLYRASLDWEVVEQEASSIAHDLALQSPKLSRREVLRLPVEKQDVLLPIFRSCRRRPYLKKQNNSRRPTPSAIAKLCLGLNSTKSKKRTSAPSSLGPLPESDTYVDMDQVVDLIDKCLKAGKRPEIHHGHPLQSTRLQGLNEEESSCILYIENHCHFNPNTMLVDVGGYRLNAQYLKCLTFDKTHDGREKFIPASVTSAYIKIISRRRANCILSKRFLVYDLGWAQNIPSMVNADVSMKSAIDHAKFLIQSELVFLPMSVNEHTIVLVVNNKSKQFQVLDSVREYSRYQSQINDTIRGIKNLLDRARSRGLHEVPDVTNWPVNQIYEIPPQEDGCSCSLFALKYIELWDGERLSTSFNQSDIHSFRVQVLVELLLSELNAMNDVKSELRRRLDEAK